MFEEHSYEFVNQEKVQIDFKKVIENQPYVFKDDNLTKKLTPKNFNLAQSLIKIVVIEKNIFQ